MKERKKKLLSAQTEGLLPRSLQAVSSYPAIELNGNVGAVFNGSAGIYEYENDHIGVVVNGMLMRLYGRNLEIVALDTGRTVITGEFRSLSFDS